MDEMKTEAGWAIVTGASSGIGRAFAVALADRGHPVLLIARRQADLEATGIEIAKRGGRARVLVADLATPLGVESVARHAEGLGNITVLVNNAGVGSYGPFVAQSPARELQQVALNIGAIVALTRSILPQMIARGDGQLINVASVLSVLPTPYLATYGATKAFVLHFSESLAQELRGSGVRVLATCPGMVRTEFARVAGSEALQDQLPLLSARDVVETSLRAAAAGRVVRVVGVRYRLLALLSWLTPRGLMRRIMGRIFAPKVGRATSEHVPVLPRSQTR